MQVTIQANCWDGQRRKSLYEPIKKELPVMAAPSTWEGFVRKMNHPGVKSIIGFGIPVLLLASGIPHIGIASAFAHTAFAATSPDVIPVMADGTKAAILHAFDPLINMIQSLAYPIAGVMIAAGCLFIMTGSKERGMAMLQNASLGYILVQLSPLLLKILVGIGDSV